MSETTKMLLQQVPIFGHLTPDIIADIGSFSRKKYLSAGEILFSEGDRATTCYIIKDGNLEILKTDPATQKPYRLAIRGKGEFLGEMSLLEESPRFATAKAIGDCVVLEISRDDFVRLIGQNPIIAMKVMEALSSRLRQADLKMINDLQIKNEQLEQAYSRLQETTAELEKSVSNLKTANRFLEKIISASEFFIIVTDSAGKVFIFNDAAKRIFGYSFQEAAGQHVAELLRPSGKGDIKTEVEEFLGKGEIFKGEMLAENKDGQKLFIELVGARVFSERGNDYASLYMGRDITAEKNLERQMIILERMATRGELAAEIAHELNNYLSIVIGNLELLQMDLESGKNSNVERKINAMKDGLDRITKFTDGLMMYSRPASKKEIFDLHEFLDNELFFIKTQSRFDGVEFECEFDREIPPIIADKSQLQQAILNLLNNAADALISSGRDDRKIIVKTSYLRETNSLKISIIDNGIGLSPENLAKVFRQHFTSKQTGHGFGLLAVKRVVKNHGGKVWAENNPDGGAIFCMEFPVNLGSPVAAESTVTD